MFSSPPGRGSSGDSGDRGAFDPVSWLQIEQGWSVVASDGSPVGTVLSVAGDKHDDIFDGLAIGTGPSAPARYVPSEQVGLIVPGRVMLRLDAAEAENLKVFTADQETVWRPSEPSFGARLSNWVRGKR